MNILNKLSIESLKLNKKRTMGTLIGIILSVVLICTVSFIAFSFRQSMIDEEISNYGYWHVKISDIDQDKLDKLRLSRDINDIKIVNEQENLFIKNEKEQLITLFSMNKDTFDYLKGKVEGNYPSNNNEVLVNKKLLGYADKKIGDEIVLSKLTEENIDNSLDENVYKNYNYKIVGTYEGDFGYSKFQALTINCTGTTNAYITLTEPRNYKRTIPKILDIKEFDFSLLEKGNLEKSKYDYEINDGLFIYEVMPLESSQILASICGVAIIAIIIIYTSIYSIRNSFSISQVERKKMYGILASVGATKKQIRKSVLFEGIILGLIGIPIGIILSIALVYIAILLLNNSSFIIDMGSKFTFCISIPAIILAIILGFLTIYLSSLRAAKNASRVSPIENIKSNQDIKITKGFRKEPKLINKLFGIGGVIAYKNLKRSKKKYRTTVVALTASIFMFITVSTIMEPVESSLDFIPTGYNIESYVMEGGWNFKEEDLKYISSLKEVENMYTLDAPYEISSIDGKNFTYKLNNNDEKIVYSDIQLLLVSDETFKNYTDKLNIDYETMKNKAIFYSPETVSEKEDDRGLDPIFQSLIDKVDVGTIFQVKELRNGNTLNRDDEIIDDTGYNFNIGYVTNTYLIDGKTGNQISSEIPYIIVNKKDYSMINNDITTYIYIKTDNPNKVEEKIVDLNSNYIVENFDKVIKSIKSLELIENVAIYGLIITLTLIGITNIFNTITSNIDLRQKEFAMLKSIGMTKKEFNHMINLEVIFYSTKALIYGISLSLLVTYMEYISTLSIEPNELYKLPLTQIIISIVVVIALIYSIMKYSVNKVSKQNIIETIRNDNI